MVALRLSSVRAALLVIVLSAIGCVLALPQATGAELPSPALETRPTREELIRAADTGELKIVPGPGLPSLESLNLTSKDLVVRALERLERLEEAEETNKELGALAKRYTPTCNYSKQIFNVNAWFCYEYLHSIGGNTCAVSGSSRFCHSVSGYGDVAWHGSVYGVSYTQSSCANVAEGGVWVLNNCKTWNPSTPDIQYEGTNAAWGNANLVVEVRNM
ncbi:hypothetical protein CC2G_013470 [Coprinopsis cinerea AmutBmut pab1-1]|nr:hypothetical protein CC2G_013470 [Coprinopsis cinerea AmutBmut pab1-1]